MRSTINEEDDVETALRRISKIRKRDPFKVLIATMLSQRTRDENTDKAAGQLFARYPSAKALTRAPLRTVEQLIHPAGFYHVKAKKIKEVAKIVTRQYGGMVPSDLESLLELPLVGRKTANCVLVYGFGKAAIPVDTHVHRISNRLGIVNTKTPEQTENQLSRYFEKKYWIEVNEIMVRFGKKICRPIGPRCRICRLRSYCKWYTEHKAKDR
jgi:endonuclease-3